MTRKRGTEAGLPVPKRVLEYYRGQPWANRELGLRPTAAAPRTAVSNQRNFGPLTPSGRLPVQIPEMVELGNDRLNSAHLDRPATSIMLKCLLS